MECATYFSISVYSRSKSMYIPFVLDQMKSQRISILYYVLNYLSISSVLQIQDIHIYCLFCKKKAFLKIQSVKCNKQNAKYILENAKCKIFFIFKNTIFQMKSVK